MTEKQCFKSIPDPDLGAFARACNKRRSYFGWSQDDVAKRANVSRAAVALIETGKRTGNLETAARVARVLGIEITRTLWPATGAI
jgi:DNA-binding XRE family transcriptional regulator